MQMRISKKSNDPEDLQQFSHFFISSVQQKALLFPSVSLEKPQAFNQ